MMDRNVFLRRLVDSLYVRNDIDLNRGNFRVKGDTVDIYLAYTDNLLRVTFWGDEIGRHRRGRPYHRSHYRTI